MKIKLKKYTEIITKANRKRESKRTVTSFRRAKIIKFITLERWNDSINYLTPKELQYSKKVIKRLRGSAI